MPSCRHKPTGFVTNQDPHEPLDLERAHMSQHTCSRYECVQSTQSKVAAFTNETARYYPFGAYRKVATA
jgi:hypothetical protein